LRETSSCHAPWYPVLKLVTEISLEIFRFTYLFWQKLICYTSNRQIGDQFFLHFISESTLPSCILYPPQACKHTIRFLLTLFQTCLNL
jgi:hypothetical protein